MDAILTWENLSKFEIGDPDRVHGENNSYSNRRLFGYGLNLREFHIRLKK